MAGPEWIPAALLPNLFAQEAVDAEVISLAPRYDPRVDVFCAIHPTIGDLLSHYTNAFNDAVDPVVLIVRADLLAKIGTVEALASFRDLVSLSVIPYSRALSVLSPHPRGVLYSNSFAFYPWMLGTDNEHLIAQTPAMRALHVVEEFHGQSSPELPEMMLSELDQTLFNALLRRWKRYYLGNRHRWQDRALFRSLNMANQAAQLPASIDTTLYDLGRIAALWVSAFEILAHPRTGNSGLNSVYPLFERVSYLTSRVGRKMYAAYMSHKRPWPRRSLPCWLYGKLYKARCAFLHGNPVRISLLSPKNYGVGLFWLAPCLYRLALAGFLDLAYTKRIPSLTAPEKLGEYIGEEMRFEQYQKSIESALLKARR